jgi:hypothetical protein
MQEFKAHLEETITKFAKFTPEESQKFFPLYYEMKEKQHELQKQMFDLKKGKMKRAENGRPSFEPREDVSDEEYTKTILKIKKLNADMADLEAEYYKRMCKAITAKKVFAVMQAEDDFHRKMLSRFNQERNRK